MTTQNYVKPKKLLPNINPDTIQSIYDKEKYDDADEARNDAILLRKYGIRLAYQRAEEEKRFKEAELKYRTLVGNAITKVDANNYYEKVALLLSTSKEISEASQKMIEFRENMVTYQGLYEQVHRLAFNIEGKAFGLGFSHDRND